MGEEERVIDLTRARFVAARVVGYLHMARCAAGIRASVAASSPSMRCCVVDVVLHEGVVGAPSSSSRSRASAWRRAVEVEAGDVEVVDRLDQQLQPRLPSAPGGESQVVDEGASQHGARRQCRRPAPCRPGSSAAARPARWRTRLRLGHARRGTRLTRSGRQAMPRSPLAFQSPAGRLCSTSLQPVELPAASLTDLGRRVVVGEHETPRSVEAGACSAAETVEKWQLGEEHREVGGKARHGRLRLQSVSVEQASHFQALKAFGVAAVDGLRTR